ncbi:Zinc finger MYND domain-containing protein 10, partial [Thoreauomyces humboldtii]
MSNEEAPLLSAFEAEHLITSLKELPLAQVASSAWMKQHENMEKLNIQAHWNTMKMCEEFVTVALVDQGKIETLVHDLLLIDTWKTLVWPKIDSKKIHPENMLIAYFVLYHESTALNLLEIVLYNQLACENLGDSITDLVDYAARKIARLAAWDRVGPNDDEPPVTVEDASLLDNPTQRLRTHLSTLSLLRNLTSNLATLPFGVTTRILVKHDLIVALCHVIERAPWEKKVRNGKRWVVQRLGEDGEWKEVDEEERQGVVGWAAQAWLALYTLLLDEQCRKHYEFNTHNHATILKLRAHITPALLDQIPPLASLLRYLEELSLFTPAESTSGRPAMGFVEELPHVERKIMEGVRDISDIIEVARKRFAGVTGDGSGIAKG